MGAHKHNVHRIVHKNNYSSNIKVTFHGRIGSPKIKEQTWETEVLGRPKDTYSFYDSRDGVFGLPTICNASAESHQRLRPSYHSTPHGDLLYEGHNEDLMSEMANSSLLSYWTKQKNKPF